MRFPGQKCVHENTPDHPAAVLEISGSKGDKVVAVRQCSICNETLEIDSRSLPVDFETKGLDAFYDFEQGRWEPVAKHKAYENRREAAMKKLFKEADDTPAKTTEE